MGREKRGRDHWMGGREGWFVGSLYLEDILICIFFSFSLNVILRVRISHMHLFRILRAAVLRGNAIRVGSCQTI